MSATSNRFHSLQREDIDNDQGVLTLTFIYREIIVSYIFLLVAILSCTGGYSNPAAIFKAFSCSLQHRIRHMADGSVREKYKTCEL